MKRTEAEKASEFIIGTCLPVNNDMFDTYTTGRAITNRIQQAINEEVEHFKKRLRQCITAVSDVDLCNSRTDDTERGIKLDMAAVYVLDRYIEKLDEIQKYKNIILLLEETMEMMGIEIDRLNKKVEDLRLDYSRMKNTALRRINARTSRQRKR